MSELPLTRALGAAAIRTQVPLVLVTIPLIVALFGIALAPLATEVLADAAHAGDERTATVTIALVVIVMIVVVTASAAAASLVLRASIRASVTQMQLATDAIARGSFHHRVNTTRRDELGQLGQSIDTMASRLERLDQARRSMLACVSHELRTPLTIIRGHAFTLARHELDAPRRERLELVQAETERLAELIEDLVDASTLDAGSVRLQVERVELGAVVRSAAQRHRDRAAAQGVAIEVDQYARTLYVDIDVGRVEQMLANLIVNAVRHAPRGASVRVSVDTCGRTRMRRVSVQNPGIIEPTVASRIFEPFVQGHDQPGRVGLGLAITSALASAHGGSLVLSNDGSAGETVEFRIELPEPSRAEPDATTAARDQTRMPQRVAARMAGA